MNSALDPFRTAQLNIGELEAAAGRLLASAPSPSDDRRVAASPDRRTLRYYQSLGVMDRPVRYEGRTALYGFRSLLQAVAVKLLQARGLSLAQVQRALAGATTARLEAAVLDGLGPAAQTVSPAEPPTTPAPVALRSVELAPGVVITVDPRVVSDPDALIERLVASLHTQPTHPTED